MGKDLKSAGAHILGLKDMAGLLKPAAARVLIKTLKDEIGLPIHFHTHDTSGIAGATILAAAEAGVECRGCRHGCVFWWHVATLFGLYRGSLAPYSA